MSSINSASFSYLTTSNKRFTGLASGMDIDSIVEKLMKAESAKMEKLQQQKQKYEWQRDSYRSVNSKLESFRSELFDNYKPSSFIPKTASVSDSSKVSVTASSSAAGSLEISSVTSLAKGASKAGALNNINALNSSHKLSDLGVLSSGTAKFTINGEEKSIVFNPSDSIDSVVSKLKSAGFENAKFVNGFYDETNNIYVNGSFSLGQDVEVTADNKNFLQQIGFNANVGDTLASTDISQTAIPPGGYKANKASTLKDLGLDLNGKEKGELTFNVLQRDGSMKATTIEYNETDTVDQLVKRINSSGAGITALFSEGQLSLNTTATGEAVGGSLQVLSDTGESLLSSIGFSSNATGQIANGENAIYTINGITKTSQTNSINELGYSITFNKTFTDGPVSVSSIDDADSIVKQVKSFVELYNGLVESLNSPLKERKEYSYQPLTDAQKGAMSEDEIKKWEEKAKKGILRNDSAISTVVSNMRSAIYAISTDKDSKYNSIFNIGITTTKTYSDGGKLEIDEKKLKAAIEENPEAVMDLFTRSAVGDDKGGLITQLRETAKTGIDTIAKKAGKAGAVENTFTLGKDLISVESKIKDWQSKLKKIEERYFKQFSAMEAAMQKANSQAGLFMQNS
ncbi:flagellar filament capping protein FliD [Lysinibacillus fusiformis]|uniref:flagellar filament capping protein FliD n=1 Tax=Lysinibacillus fusiformis TaxID=28031 RepID=UPI0021BE80D1|nr:flagellar filament capping protein FliD [Lysinibacillus fusiformis]UXJ69548.1 flagellar filament capping protein FliD [Lysinibacillus fusiformis]